MKLSWSVQNANSYAAFADDSVGDYISGFKPRMQGIAQTTPLFRAINQFVSARNNRLWVCEGTVEKAFVSAAAAALYIENQAAALPDFVDIQIQEGATAIYLTPAVLVGYEPEYKGASVIIKYSFVAGTLTAAAPGGS